ncbi:uncharacterized protein [Mytilus edulis]|uniref:uncharacterized protein n=1 Tax=Mytilus edulis TaxID=6550 RepID=UPI0039F094FA
MSDKDMIERDVIREEIPNVPLLICLFHVLRIFKREVTTEKLGISKDERILALELLQKMAYARTEDSYSEFYRELKDTNLESVIRYFDKNWHPIRTEWVEGLKDNTTNLMNNTNNRVESTNQKLKGVISKFSNIVAFFDDLMKTVKSLRTERDHRAITIFQKVKVNRFESNSSLSEYLKQVTPFAFGYIAKQMEASHKITYDGAITSNTVAVSLPSSDCDLTVTATTCDCGFFKSITLPCRHILVFRRQFY